MAMIAIHELPSMRLNDGRDVRGGYGAMQRARMIGRNLGLRRTLDRWLAAQPFAFAQQTVVAVNTPDYQYAHVKQTAFAFGNGARIVQNANIFQGPLFAGLF